MKKIHNITHPSFQKLGAYIVSLGLLAAVGVLSLGLVSCSGSGPATPVTPSTETTITELSPPGIVASAAQRTLRISGTNFKSDMTVRITGSSGVGGGIIVTSPQITDTLIVFDMVIGTAPVDRYVNVSVRAATGEPLATAVLGVAEKDVTLAGVSLILTDNTCTGCHSGAKPDGGLNLVGIQTDSSRTGLIGQPSLYCSGKLRIKPGDPRRSSSVLIDAIQPAPQSSDCVGLTPMPKRSNVSVPAVPAPDIQTIIDWVAGGAR